MITHAIEWGGSYDDDVADASAETVPIEQALRDDGFRPSEYVPDPNLEMALIEQAALAA